MIWGSAIDCCSSGLVIKGISWIRWVTCACESGFEQQKYQSTFMVRECARGREHFSPRGGPGKEEMGVRPRLRTVALPGPVTRDIKGSPCQGLAWYGVCWVHILDPHTRANAYSAERPWRPRTWTRNAWHNTILWSKYVLRTLLGIIRSKRRDFCPIRAYHWVRERTQP